MSIPTTLILLGVAAALLAYVAARPSAQPRVVRVPARIADRRPPRHR